jgi:predicted metal-dependent peptidase
MAEHQVCFQAVAKSISQLQMREPFYGHIAGQLKRCITGQISTAAVTFDSAGDIELLVNPAFFMEELDVDERVAVIKHELLHVVLKHLSRLDWRKHNPQLLNLAADLVVNQYVKPWPLPEGAITLTTFPELNLPAAKPFEYYYEILQKQAKESPQSITKIILNGSKRGEHLWEGETAQNSSNNQDNLVSGWKLDRLIGDALDASGSDFGTLPQPLRKAVLADRERLKESQVDWRRSLRLFASAGSRTEIKTTRRKMSKRFEGNPGIRIKRKKRFAVVIDTSGSIQEEQLLSFQSEISAIYRSGIELTVVECDAAIGRHYDFSGKFDTKITGGGGTCFDPAIAWVNDRSNGRFDGCIYFTDGYAQKPSSRSMVSLLWVLTREHNKQVASFEGRTILLKD